MKEVEEETASHEKKNLKWTNDMNDLLIQTLIGQNLKGRKIGERFTAIAYRVASNMVTGKFM